MTRSEKSKTNQRLSVFIRLCLAIVGGFIATTVVTAAIPNLLETLLGVDSAATLMWMMLLSFAVYCGFVMWIMASSDLLRTGVIMFVIIGALSVVNSYIVRLTPASQNMQQTS